MGAYGMFL
jgi:hypothetical protein